MLNILLRLSKQNNSKDLLDGIDQNCRHDCSQICQDFVSRSISPLKKYLLLCTLFSLTCTRNCEFTFLLGIASESGGYAIFFACKTVKIFVSIYRSLSQNVYSIVSLITMVKKIIPCFKNAFRLHILALF
jgi:hypothetical protein